MMSIYTLLCRGAELDVCICYETDPAFCAAVQWLEPAQTAGKKLPYLFTQCEVHSVIHTYTDRIQTSAWHSLWGFNIIQMTDCCQWFCLTFPAGYPCTWDVAMSRYTFCEEHLLCQGARMYILSSEISPTCLYMNTQYLMPGWHEIFWLVHINSQACIWFQKIKVYRCPNQSMPISYNAQLLSCQQTLCSHCIHTLYISTSNADIAHKNCYRNLTPVYNLLEWRHTP